MYNQVAVKPLSRTVISELGFLVSSIIAQYWTTYNRKQTKTKLSKKKKFKKRVFFGYKNEQMGLQLCEAESKTETKQK